MIHPDVFALFIAIASLLLLVYLFLLRPDPKQEQHYADLEQQIKEDIEKAISEYRQIEKSEKMYGHFAPFATAITRHELPLIHSTEHQTTIYAHKADA
jgi:hypothetical protein